MDNFDIFYVDNATGWELGLSAKNKAIGSFAEKIIMKGDTAIKSIIIYDQNGDSIQYLLSNHRYPAELNTNEKAFFALQ